MPQQNRFTGQHVLVTGGSHGIGQAIARRFAQEGASVAINFAKSAEGAQRTLGLANSDSEAAGIQGSDHFIVKADVGDQEQVAAMFRDVAARWPTLDVLVNNAGIQAPSPSHQLDHEMLRRVVDVNLLGAAYCSELAIRHFLSRPGGGAIVNCSSVHQIIPKPTYLGYSISKGGLGNLTRTLALEYAEHGIRVNAVGPGAIVTPINDAWINDPKKRAAVESHIPMGRAGESDEIAAVVAFLASREASYVTGQTLYACGGLTLFNEFRTNWSS
jgi:glucose 1-dehydrogenase